MQPPEYLVVAAVAAPHGVQGELRLYPLTEFPERIGERPMLRLRMPEGEVREFRIRSSRMHKGMVLVRLQGVGDRTAAEELRGASVIISPEEAAPLPEGRYYEYQLIGLRVVTPEGEELGTIREIMPGASNDVYLAGPWLIPATHDAVREIDLEKGVLVVRSRAYLEGEEVR